MTGEVRRRRSDVNSRDTQLRARLDRRYPAVGLRPGVPNSDGRTAVQPISATARPKSATRGVMPGISAMTMTAGPSPVRSTVREVPPWANSSMP